MPSSTTSATASASSSFASLLATLSEPAQKNESGWEDDELADDVATLSYEHVLRDNAFYHAAAQPPVAHAAVPRKAQAPQATQPSPLQAASEKSKRKNTSVTLRLSEAECAQLHKRASEAGLTVSAYLRSCAFEVESLREMVKTTLAQLREATNQVKPVASVVSASPAQPRNSRLHRFAGCLGSIFTPAQSEQYVART